MDEELWDGWTSVCAGKLQELSQGEFLVLVLNDPENVFIQMARTGESDLLAEVSLGNHSERESLMQALIDLGWAPPGSYLEGPNLQLMWRTQEEATPEGGFRWWKFGADSDDWLSREDAEDAAGLIASTLRYVMGVSDPTKIPVNRDNF